MTLGLRVSNSSESPLLISTPGSGVPTLVGMLSSNELAAMTGLVFGIYPAMKAAKQDAIVALRHD